MEREALGRVPHLHRGHPAVPLEIYELTRHGQLLQDRRPRAQPRRDGVPALGAPAVRHSAAGARVDRAPVRKRRGLGGARARDAGHEPGASVADDGRVHGASEAAEPAGGEHDEAMATTLAPLAEDWDRALCVVAHPDDLEFGASSAVARWTDCGKGRRVRARHPGRGRASTPSAQSSAGSSDRPNRWRALAWSASSRCRSSTIPTAGSPTPWSCAVTSPVRSAATVPR